MYKNQCINSIQSHKPCSIHIQFHDYYHSGSIDKCSDWVLMSLFILSNLIKLVDDPKSLFKLISLSFYPETYEEIN